ncbi:MAG: hypothetical protein Q9194_001134, partial [Teloschistes cf. exilis]
HPRPSDIERDEDDPEYLPVEGWGNCFDCSQAPASVIAKMKQNGDYEKTDPWGAMSRPEVGMGSSKNAASASLEEIGRGVSHAQAKQYAEAESTTSPATSEAEEEYDLSPSKGKGRAGEPVRQHPNAVTLTDDSSDDEGNAPLVREIAALLRARSDEDTDSDEEEDKKRNYKATCRGHATQRTHKEEEDDEEEESEEVEQEGEDRKTTRSGHRKQGDHVGLGGGAKAKGQANIPDCDDNDDDDDDDDEDKSGIASPEECKAVGIPHGQGFTKERVRMIAARRKQSAQLAMFQFQKGEIE